MKKILLTGFAFFGVSCIAMAQNEPAKAKKSTQKIVIVTNTDAKPASAERVKAKMEKEKAAAVAVTPSVVSEAVENVPTKKGKN